MNDNNSPIRLSWRGPGGERRPIPGLNFPVKKIRSWMADAAMHLRKEEKNNGIHP